MLSFTTATSIQVEEYVMQPLDGLTLQASQYMKSYATCMDCL